VLQCIQGVQFSSDLKVLSLPYYDIIVGMDWLARHSPMKIDWLNKWVVINHEGSPVQLHGIQPSLSEFSLVEVLLLSDHEDVLTDTCLLQ
jgi:hypothetical protein